MARRTRRGRRARIVGSEARRGRLDRSPAPHRTVTHHRAGGERAGGEVHHLVVRRRGRPAIEVHLPEGVPKPPASQVAVLVESAPVLRAHPDADPPVSFRGDEELVAVRPPVRRAGDVAVLGHTTGHLRPGGNVDEHPRWSWVGGRAPGEDLSVRIDARDVRRARVDGGEGSRGRPLGEIRLAPADREPIDIERTRVISRPRRHSLIRPHRGTHDRTLVEAERHNLTAVSEGEAELGGDADLHELTRWRPQRRLTLPRPAPGPSVVTERTRHSQSHRDPVLGVQRQAEVAPGTPGQRQRYDPVAQVPDSPTTELVHGERARRSDRRSTMRREDRGSSRTGDSPGCCSTCFHTACEQMVQYV